jgi:hypothetical protein
MKLFDSELQYLSELYTRLGEELARLKNVPGSACPATVAEAVLRHQELFSRIDKMNSRVFQMAQEWEKLRPYMDTASRKKTLEFAGSVRKQALDLKKAIEEQAQPLENRLAEIKRDLAGLTQGARYLASVKPAATNYPKFIDSVG